MKIKTLLVALTTSASLLVGCSGKVAWKTYSYDRVLTNAEKDALVAKVRSATLSKISRHESKTVYAQKTALTENKGQTTSVAEFYLKGEAYGEEVQKFKRTANGRVQDYSNKTKNSFASVDEENHKFALVTEKETTDNNADTFTYQEQTIAEGYEYAGAASDLNTVFSTLAQTSVQAVEDKSGKQFFLRSYELETNTPMSWEHETRNQYSLTRIQYAAFLNKDYSLKSFTKYTYSKTNYDSETKVIEKSAKFTYENTEEHKFIYGDKKDGSSKVAAVKSLAKEGVKLVSEPTFSMFSYKADGTELNNFNVESAIYQRVGYGKYHVAYYFNELQPKVAEEDVATYKMKFAGSSKSNAKEDPVEFNLDVAVENYNAGNSGTSFENGAIKMVNREVDIVVEFDVEATAEGATLSNVSAVANLSYDF